MTITHYIPDTTPPIPYTIIHSARRTLGLEVRDGKVTVRVPNRLPEREAERFVAKHTDWIIKKLSEDKQRQQQKSAYRIPAPQELTQSQIEQMKLEFETKTKKYAAQMNVTVGIFPAHLFRVREDLLDVTLQEVDAGNVKQRLQWCDQRMNGAFIKTWADTHLRLWRNYCNINGLLMFIRQSCGA